MSFNVANMRNYADINQRVMTSVRGTPLPTTPTGSWGPGWYDLGAIEASNGVSEAVNVNETKIYLWQGGGLGRVLRSQFEHPFTITCAEENAVTLGLARANSIVTTTGGTAEVQTVTITGTPTGGTFSLVLPTYGVAAGIAYNAATTAVATAINALLPSGYTATVTGTAGTSYVVTFPASLGNVPQMSIITTALTGGTPGGSVATTTPGANPVNSSYVVPASTQNIRQFGFDFSDGVVHVRLILTYAEAVQSGTITRNAAAISSVPLTINPYLDPATGAFFQDINDDPARAASLFV